MNTRFFLPFVVGAIFQTPLNAQLTTGLVSYLEFETDASNSAPATGSAGILIDGASAGEVGGLRGNALRLDATETTNQHVNLAVPFGPGTDLGQDFSISAWYSLNANPAPNGTSRYFVFESDSNFEISYSIRDLGLGEAGINDGQIYTTSENTPVSDAAIPGWQHVIQTYSTNGNVVTVQTFINGVAAPTLTTGSASFAGTGINIGAARNAASTRGFDGLIDELAIWDRTLSVEEAFEVYARGQTGEAIATSDPADPAPQVVSFEATPASVLAGEEITLSWEVTGSTTVLISSGIGTVDPQASQSQTLEESTSFTLVALNGNSSVSSTVEVAVLDPPADVEAGLVAYYGMEADLGNDPAASGPDATNVNGATVGVSDGIAGNALQLSTLNNEHIKSLVTFGGEDSDLGDSFSVSAWYNLKVTPEPNGSNRYFVFESSETYPISYGLREANQGEIGVYDGQTFTLGGNQIYPDAGLEGWRHVLVRYTASGGSTLVETFVDGALSGSFSAPTSGFTGTGINFGAPRDSVTNRGFDGLMDEVALWSRPLTDSEVALVYERGLGGEGLTGALLPLAISDVVYDSESGTTTLEFTSKKGGTYAIDRSSDLEVWNELNDNFQATSELSVFQDSGAGPEAYYRVRRLD
ncbi:LamG domain-containing protein [Akkermansiaceae bacterium]|nr:LamG domain-containing protein [Akkermansiaceae bacterium]